MIAKLICNNTIDDGKSLEIAFEIEPINEWKFMRWIDLMNAYDDYRKSFDDYNTLRKEIIEDYNKDYREDDDKW